MPAKTKPHILLESYLDEQQLKDFHNYGHFFVITDQKLVYQLKDGTSVVQWHERGEATAFHVWAETNGSCLDRYTSLLTQYLFLTSTDPDEMLDVACDQGRHWGDNRGVPKMIRYCADPEGTIPSASRW